MVVLVSTVHDSGDLGGIVILIDFIFSAEVIVINSNGFSDSGISGGKESIISIPIVESNNHGGIDLSSLRFLDEFVVPVSIDGLFNSSGCFSVSFSGIVVPLALGEGGSEFQGVSGSDSVPEEIVGSDFFPKITSLVRPFFNNVIEVVFDGSSVVNSIVSSPEVGFHVIRFGVFVQNFSVFD